MISKRYSGLLLPLFSLRRDKGKDHGIGDLIALEEWIDWASEHEINFLQLLPINAVDKGDAPSPYSAISSIALEPMYLSLERIPGIEPELPPYPYDLPSRQFPKELPEGNPLVDYERVREYKELALRQAWKNFLSSDSLADERQEHQDWLFEQSSWLRDYSNYRVAGALFKSLEWSRWAIQDPNTIRSAIEHDSTAIEQRRYHEWQQWLCAREWKRVRAHADKRGIMLMGDLPIGISVNSSDVFFERDQFDMEWSGGAPPEGNFADDPFTAKWGQNWGIPLYRWNVMKHDNYAWWGRRISSTSDIFSMYRIDHILGFYRIYSFPWMPYRNQEFLNLSPDQAAARCNGRRPGFIPRPDWTREDKLSNHMQGDELLRAIKIKSGNLHLIGEDLGCVPDYVRPNLSQLRIAGFKIPHWEIDNKAQIIRGETYNPCSFATYATHDFPPISADWNNWYSLLEKGRSAPYNPELTPHQQRDAIHSGFNCQRVLHWLADYSNMSEKQSEQPWCDEIKDALFRALMNCNSRYIALMWTELFDIPERLNTPGTEGGSNWRLRMPMTAAEASSMPQSKWIQSIAKRS